MSSPLMSLCKSICCPVVKISRDLPKTIVAVKTRCRLCCAPSCAHCSTPEWTQSLSTFGSAVLQQDARRVNGWSSAITCVSMHVSPPPPLPPPPSCLAPTHLTFQPLLSAGPRRRTSTWRGHWSRTKERWSRKRRSVCFNDCRKSNTTKCSRLKKCIVINSGSDDSISRWNPGGSVLRPCDSFAPTIY